MDSELIEEARDALTEYGRSQPNDYERACADPLADALRSMFAVFEAAHAKEPDTSPEPVKNGADSLRVPDDEREALIEDRKAVLAVLNQSPALPADVVSAQIMMVLMDRGFRRPVSPEPRDDNDFAPGECTGAGDCDAPMHIHGCYRPHRADRCDSPDEYGHIEPQTEPTTVQLMARRGGKAQALIDSMLAQANERGIRVEIVHPEQATDREDGSSYPTPPCATCGEPVYLTVSGAWRHVERDYAHEVAPEREDGSRNA